MHQNIVDKRALGIEHGRVLGLALASLPASFIESACIATREPRAAELNFSHVADVKESYAGADRHVLGGDSGVFDRHIPAVEVDHFGSEMPVVPIEERFCAKRGWRGNRGERTRQVPLREK